MANPMQAASAPATPPDDDEDMGDDAMGSADQSGDADQSSDVLVTITKNGVKRGCWGSVFPRCANLAEEIIENMHLWIRRKQ